MSDSEMTSYPVRFSVDYPDRELNRLTTFFRLLVALPILIVIGLLTSGTFQYNESGEAAQTGIASGGILFVPVLLLIVFRQKYPRWWYEWNLHFQRFANRVAAYLLLLRDEYPSTDEEQAVHLDFPYPDARTDLNRWLPLVKWLLAIPHLVVLVFLTFGAIVAALISWVAILITGRYPRSLFDFVVGVMRWHNRVVGYALTLVTDAYPPFRLNP